MPCNSVICFSWRWTRPKRRAFSIAIAVCRATADASRRSSSLKRWPCGRSSVKQPSGSLPRMKGTISIARGLCGWVIGGMPAARLVSGRKAIRPASTAAPIGPWPIGSGSEASSPVGQPCTPTGSSNWRLSSYSRIAAVGQATTAVRARSVFFSTDSSCSDEFRFSPTLISRSSSRTFVSNSSRCRNSDVTSRAIV